MLLRIDDLQVHYGKVEALQGVSLRMENGEIVAILGSNGAGKTTLLRTVSGLKMPTSGTIVYQENKISGLSPDEIVALGIAQVPEGRLVFPNMSVKENLKLGAYVHGWRGVEEVISQVFSYFPMLAERPSQHAGSLSGGQQQMLAIGRSLMSEPKLLLMDEPSMGLAPLVVRQIARITREINQSGVSILLVEQNARMALGLAHRAYVIETGRVALEGTAQQLANNEQVKRVYLGL